MATLEEFLKSHKGRAHLMSAMDLVVPTIPTGVLALDHGVLAGGLPKGRLVEIYGTEGAGKTTLALTMMAAATQRGEMVGLVDAEHGYNPAYGAVLGLDPDKVVVCTPDYGEQAFDDLLGLVETGQMSIVCLDSVAGLVPKAELDNDMEAKEMGTAARIIAKGIRKLLAAADRTGTVVVMLNQIRMKLGVVFGNPETTPGGNALRFFASVRIEIRASTKVKDGEAFIGQSVTMKAIKNRFKAPFAKESTNLMYGVGYDNMSWLLDRGIDLRVVSKTGAHYDIEGERIGHGRQASMATLAMNPNLQAKIFKAIQEES